MLTGAVEVLEVAKAERRFEQMLSRLLGIPRRSPDRTIERPMPDVLHLLPHRLRQRHHVPRRVEEIGLRELAILEVCRRERRDDALLDLRAGPAPAELLDRLEVELVR